MFYDPYHVFLNKFHNIVRIAAHGNRGLKLDANREIRSDPIFSEFKNLNYLLYWSLFKKKTIRS